MINFIKVASVVPVVADIAFQIRTTLAQNKRVLWLVSGGSAVSLEVAAMEQLQDVDRAKLTIMQVDERYGKIGHADSNWQKLLDAGFEPGTAKSLPILMGGTLEATTQNYNKEIQQATQENDFCIGVFGMGADGHTAGMLPETESATELHDFVASYTGPDFQRITITPAAIAKLDAAIVYAVGPEKIQALQNLKKTLPAKKQPAQVLKQVKNVYMYNDYMEGTA